jgi:hypothetical protein
MAEQPSETHGSGACQLANLRRNLCALPLVTHFVAGGVLLFATDLCGWNVLASAFGQCSPPVLCLWDRI